MRTTLVNYASPDFFVRQRVNSLSGLMHGGVDRYASYRRQHLDRGFIDKHRFLLTRARGAGLWLWKPHIIKYMLEQAAPDDVIVYSDSGARFVGAVGELVSTCLSLRDGILGFAVGDGFIERAWTKRDTFVLMNCDRPEFTDTLQIRTGLIILANRPASRDFVAEWSDLMGHIRLVSDLPSVCGEADYPDFQNHRHDQSVFSLLYKLRGYRSYAALTGGGIETVVQRLGPETSAAEQGLTYLHPAMYLKNVRTPMG